jgi:hypothetical protein
VRKVVAGECYLPMALRPEHPCMTAAWRHFVGYHVHVAIMPALQGSTQIDRAKVKKSHEGERAEDLAQERNLLYCGLTSLL